MPRGDGIYVFRSERGGKLSTDIVRVICERAGQAAGFGFRVRPHMFRHAAGFALAEEGTDTRLIQDPWPQGHQEHGDLYRDLPTTACGSAGAIGDRENLLPILRRLTEIERHLRLTETPQAPRPSRRHPMGA